MAERSKRTDVDPETIEADEEESLLQQSVADEVVAVAVVVLLLFRRILCGEKRDSRKHDELGCLVEVSSCEQDRILRGDDAAAARCNEAVAEGVADAVAVESGS